MTTAGPWLTKRRRRAAGDEPAKSERAAACFHKTQPACQSSHVGSGPSSTTPAQVDASVSTTLRPHHPPLAIHATRRSKRFAQAAGEGGRRRRWSPRAPRSDVEAGTHTCDAPAPGRHGNTQQHSGVQHGPGRRNSAANRSDCRERPDLGDEPGSRRERAKRSRLSGVAFKNRRRGTAREKQPAVRSSPRGWRTQAVPTHTTRSQRCSRVRARSAGEKIQCHERMRAAKPGLFRERPGGFP